MSPGPCFPVLTGSARTQAASIVRRRVSLLGHRQRVVHAPTPWYGPAPGSGAVGESPHVEPLLQPALSNGAAGLAVMHAVFAVVSGERLSRAMAGWHLKDAIATLEAVELEIDFFDGFGGVAWSVLACRRVGIQPAGLDEVAVQAHLGRIDAVLGEWLQEASNEDLTAFERGLGALCVYAFERARSDAGSSLADAAIERILDLGAGAWSAGVESSEVASWLLLLRGSRAEGLGADDASQRARVLELARPLAGRLAGEPARSDSLLGVCAGLRRAFALADLGVDREHSAHLTGRAGTRDLLQATREFTADRLNPDDRVFVAWLAAKLGDRCRDPEWIAESARGYDAAIRHLGRRPLTDDPPRLLSDTTAGLPYGHGATILHWLPAIARSVPDLAWICGLRQSAAVPPRPAPPGTDR